MTVKDIKDAVKVTLDENLKIASLVGDDGEPLDDDTLELNEIIENKILDGVNAIYMIAPLERLKTTNVGDVAITITNEHVGLIDNPADCLRLVSILATSWKRPVTYITTPDMSEYAQQFSEFVGVRGNASKPVAIPNPYANDNKLALFSVKTGDSVTMSYVANAAITGTGDDRAVDIPSKVERACILKIAANVAATYQNGDLMQLLNSLCLEQLGMRNNS